MDQEEGQRGGAHAGQPSASAGAPESSSSSSDASGGGVSARAATPQSSSSSYVLGWAPGMAVPPQQQNWYNASSSSSSMVDPQHHHPYAAASAASRQSAQMMIHPQQQQAPSGSMIRMQMMPPYSASSAWSSMAPSAYHQQQHIINNNSGMRMSSMMIPPAAAAASLQQRQAMLQQQRQFLQQRQLLFQQQQQQAIRRDEVQTRLHEMVDAVVASASPEAAAKKKQRRLSAALAKEEEERSRAAVATVVVTRDVSQLTPSQQTWVESIVGREWELYWNQDSSEVATAAAATGTSTEPNPQPVVVASEESAGEKKTDDDAHPQPVADAVMKESEHEDDMPVEQLVTMKREEKVEDTVTMDAVDEDEDNNIISNSNDVSNDNSTKDCSSTDEDETSNIEHEEDWYDATVESFESLRKSDGDDGTEFLYFNVCFVGDETMYQMVVSPDTVRPSARAWIRRTKAMLQEPGVAAMEPSEAEEQQQQPDWEASLPLDTRMLDDHEKVKSIEQQVDVEFPVVSAVMFHCIDEDASTTLQKLHTEHRTCCRWLRLIRSQLYLRSRLAHIDNQEVENGGDDNDDDEVDPTESYVDFLAKCLSDLEKALQWHFKCWQLLYRIFAGDENNEQQQRQSSTFSREYLVGECLSAGRLALSTLLSMKDLSVKAARVATKGRKRPAPVSQQNAPVSPSRRPASARRRAKRRRKSRTFSETWMVPTDPFVGDVYDEEEEEEDLFTSDLIDRFVDEVCQMDSRWFIKSCGNMLQSISSMVAVPFVRWERRAQFFLGERETLDVTASDGETIVEDLGDDGSDSIDDDCDHDDDADPGQGDQEGNAKRRFVKYEEIEALLDNANHNRVLKCFDLSAYVEKLDRKLRAVDSFEKRAWDLILATLDDPEKDNGREVSLFDKDIDPTLRGLQALLQEAALKEGPIENMNPIGRVSSTLSRGVLENAMVYRLWFLDLIYAECVRERIAFLDGVVSRLSKLPPLPSRHGSSSDQNSNTDIGAKLDLVAPRVRNLSAKYMDHIAKFHRYQSLLDERVLPSNSSNRKGFLTLEGARDALNELQQLCVISVAEEMLAVRIDTLLWEAKAKSILSKNNPAFADVLDLKQSLDMILEGRSKTRDGIRRGKKRSSETEAEIKMFGHSDAKSLCGPLYTQTVTLYSAAAAWKERADAVLSVLVAFGNTGAGDGPATGVKPSSMVDLRRIDDLISEYARLNVDLGSTFGRLTGVHDAAIKWSSSVSACLEDDTLPFEECRTFVERIGLERPAGLIVHPTRQVVDQMGELFQWYIGTKEYVSSGSVDKEQIQSLLASGIQVVERYSRERRAKDEFSVPANALEIILARDSSGRKTPRTLSIAKLESSPLASAVVDRMTDEARDEKEGSPLFCLLFALWTYHVEDFLERCRVPKESQSNVSLAIAQNLQKARPSRTGARSGDHASITDLLSHLVPREFDDLVYKGEQMEEAARVTLLASNKLLRESSQQTDLVASHLEKLKTLHADFVKGRWSPVGFVALDPRLEQSLDRDVKLFGWLVRTFPYPVLQSHLIDESQMNEETGEDNRVPWEVLVSLHDRTPSSDLVLGDFACIVLRVKELYVAARKWQDDISNFTMLSLRGGKRRESAEDPDASLSIDLNLVAELCQHPILAKVAMPREKGIRTMLQSTRKFEVELYEFLDKDYDGESPDRVAIPERGSLVGPDGTFLLYRLTGSPLFQALRLSIESISKLANAVLANTPGKAAFDWIHQAFDWIDSIQAKVTTKGASLGEHRLSIPGIEAKKLLSRADELFQQLPDDLRGTLSLHKIFISATKDGKLTVKSRKGGAHYAVGATCIRWCPFLYNALKLDVAKLRTWEATVSRISEDFLSIRKYAEGRPLNDPVVLQRSFACREDLSQLVVEGAELVVLPSSTLVDSCKTLLRNISGYLQKYADHEAVKSFVNSRYVDAFAVTENRNLLLDSLLGRKAAPKANDTDGLESVSSQSHFRTAGRTIFTNALKKGATTLDLPDREASLSLCEFKAWEIENALFDRYQEDLGESQISPDYREKARALRRSLEDPGNLSLCVNVLCGKTSPDVLVRMSTDQLANPTVRRDRERAAFAARQSVVLTGPSSSAEKSGSKLAASSMVARKTKQTAPLTKKVTLTRHSSGDTHSPGISPPATNHSSLKASTRSSAPPDLSNAKSPPNTMRAMKPESKFTDLIKSASKATRAPPPPPPSLVDMSLKSCGEMGASFIEEPLASSSGGDEFFLTLADGARSFFAHLYPESDPQNEADGYLPGSLTEKGRLTTDNFSKFLADKLKGGRWYAMVLRLDTMSDKDSKEYKKFYKEYEGVKQRIAMFALSAGAKAFLVTPRFHRIAKGVSFERSTSSYVVVLTKKM